MGFSRRPAKGEKRLYKGNGLSPLYSTLRTEADASPTFGAESAIQFPAIPPITSEPDVFSSSNRNRKQHPGLSRNTSMPVSKKRRKLANSSAEQATRKRLLTSPLARDEANRIVLLVRIGLEAIRCGRNEQTALLDMHSVVLLTEMMTAGGGGALPLDMLRETGRQVIQLLEEGGSRKEWTVPAALSDTLTAVVNEYDRMLHQMPLQAVLAATGKLERLEREDPRYSRTPHDHNSAKAA